MTLEEVRADALLSVAQAADLIGMSRSWLDKKRVLGGGPVYVKLGKRVLYARLDLQAWALSHRRESTSE